MSISARASNTQFKASKDNTITEIEVKDLATPIKIEIPLKQAITDSENTQCMYLDVSTNKWVALESTCEPAQAGQKKVTCCSSHLTTFTVQKVTYRTVEEDLHVAAATSSSEICTAHLHFIMAVNVFLLIFVVTGCCLDRKQKLVYEPAHAKGAHEANQKHEAVPRDSIPHPMQLPETEMQNVSVNIVGNVDTPDRESRAVSPNDIKLQMDNVAEHGQSSSSLGSAVNNSQIFSAADLGQHASVNTQSYVNDWAKQQSFGQLFCNSFKFYGRLVSICFTHNARLGRATKAFSLATQVMLLATIVSMIGLFSQDESWRLASYEFVAVFFLMRFFQFLLGTGLSRGENTSKSFVCASVTLFTVIYLICTAIVFNTAERESEETQHTIINDTMRCLLIELVVWDMLLMPLSLAALASACKKRRGIFMHYRGLLV